MWECGCTPPVTLFSGGHRALCSVLAGALYITKLDRSESDSAMPSIAISIIQSVSDPAPGTQQA